jgi:hypothetical protein
VLKSDDGFTHWHELKKEPTKPTSKTIATYIRYIQWLKSLAAWFLKCFKKTV